MFNIYVHGALEARILEWFAIPSSSGPGFVRTLYYDLSILDGSAPHGSLSYTSPFHHSKAVIHEGGSYTRSTVTGSRRSRFTGGSQWLQRADLSHLLTNSQRTRWGWENKDEISLLLSHAVLQLFCSPMDCSPPDSSVPGILQARILEWVAIPFPSGSS